MEMMEAMIEEALIIFIERINLWVVLGKVLHILGHERINDSFTLQGCVCLAEK